MLKVLKDLALALLNATLMLVAICLFLGLRLTDRVENVMATVTANAVQLLPIQENAQSLISEVSGLREDVQKLTAIPGEVDPDLINRMERRSAALQERADAFRARLDGLSGKPADLIDQAIETAAQEFAVAVTGIWGCTPMAGNLADADTPPLPNSN